MAAGPAAGQAAGTGEAGQPLQGAGGGRDGGRRQLLLPPGLCRSLQMYAQARPGSCCGREAEVVRGVRAAPGELARIGAECAEEKWQLEQLQLL